MAEIPKIARERLRAHSQAGDHPDANLLTAFAEQALSERERSLVLEHLAQCHACRQVLSLALPGVLEQELVAAAAAHAGAAPLPPEPRPWWRWQNLRWAALAASTAVVLVAVLVIPERRKAATNLGPVAMSDTQQLSRAAAPSAAETAVQPTPQAQKAQPPVEARKTEAPRPGARVAVRNQATVFTQKSAVVGAGTAEGIGSGSGGGIVAGTYRTPEVAAAPPAATAERQAPAAAPGAGSAAKGVSGVETADLAKAPAQPAERKESVQSTVAPAAAGSASATVAVTGGPITSKGNLSPGVAGRPLAARAKPVSLGMRWSISESGRLQSSSDAGRTWKTAEVGEGVTFRAAVALGTNVWAGGSGGALYHSPDAGEHWSRLAVRDNSGQALTGDIVRLDFTDADHGVVVTSTGETWATADGGKSWKRP